MSQNVTMPTLFVSQSHGCHRKFQTLRWLYRGITFFFLESLWLSLLPHSLPRSISSIILCVVYRSTANGQPENVVLSHHIRSNLDSLLMKQPNALVLIAGDFNPTSTGLKLKGLTQSISVEEHCS